MSIHRLSTLGLAALLAAACSDFATAPDRTPAELRVSPDTLMLLTGEAAEFHVQLVDGNGDVYETIPAWAPPLWTSDRPDRVDLTGGKVTPVKGGQQTMHVELAGLAAKAVLRANPTSLAVTTPMIYITQSVQRRAGDVPLIAGRDGLLRVIVNGDDENYYRPRVRATFHNGGKAVYSALMDLAVEGLPTSVREGNIFMSYNADVPGDVLQPGVGLVVEIDTDGVVPATPGSTLRVPATGTLDLGVRTVSPFRLTVVPVEQAAFPNRKPRFTPSYARQMLQLTEDIFPFSEFELHVRDPYVTQARLDEDRGWYALLYEIETLRWDDGSSHYYYGGVDRPPGTNIGGLGFVGKPVSIGMDNRPDIIAHEIGHTLNLPHAPCGNPNIVDKAYPYPSGSVGQYGYDRTRRRLQDPSDRYDLMSYCSPIWVSDYNYEKVLDYRDRSPYDAPAAGTRGAAMSALSAGKESTLLVQGGVLEGVLRLEPALEWEGRVTLPAGGRYTLEGLDAQGGVLFSLSLEPDPLDHLESAQFLVALPVAMARPDRLERLRLSGPEGVVERPRAGRVFRHAPELRVDGGVAHWDESAFPLAVIRDRQTGRIRAMSRTGTITMPDAAGADFDVLMSDGLATRHGQVIRR